jgi:electron transport complex protein RnfG
MNARHILTSAVLLGLFALIGTGIVALLHEGTDDRIAENQRLATLRNLNAILPHERYDNELLADQWVIQDEILAGGQPVTVYRAFLHGEPVAAVFATVAPDGYGGPIHLLVGVNVDGTVAGVRVTAHRETPGLGDAIEASRSDWILGFDGRSLEDPPLERWAVARDGGVFDQFTGATISPRAVVGAVREVLLYFAAHGETIFPSPAAPAGAAPTESSEEEPDE